MEKSVNLTINGQEVSATKGQTILQAAEANNIFIPTLCYVKDLLPTGSCRLCVVEVAGSRTLVGSCHTPVGDGMKIQTHSPRVLEARRNIINLIMASHPDSCLICEEANRCELRRLAMDMDIGLPVFNARKHYYAPEDDNSAIRRDMAKCILCHRCVTVCAANSGKKLFSIAYRGFNSKVVHGQDEVIAADACGDCNACIETCPTGALTRPRVPGEAKKGPVQVIRG
ncbi:2Fe-2S iron-sulfur cluster-binding protein [Chloroflexota bacterium]